MFRVAALQYATTTDVDHNLATCLRMIDEAARQHRPELMVMSEFSNHLSWYRDREHALRVAVTLDGPFLSAIAEHARKHQSHIVINCSVRREGDRITVTSLLYGPDGALLAEADKQTLMGHENMWFARAEAISPIVVTEKARIAMYPCRDGVTMETPRCLALRGAQVLCNSLNSFALDEASLHVPARAPENRVFVVAANKVGPLVPEAELELASQATFIPVPYLYGAGESQIVSPTGAVLAKAPREGEAIVVCDIEPSEADDKRRPDGTSRLSARRPDLYRPIGFKPRERPVDPASAELEVACVAGLSDSSVEGALTTAVERVRELSQDGVQLIVLPELFCFAGGQVDDPDRAAEAFVSIVRALAEACARTRAHVATSLVERADDAFVHAGLLVGPAGIVARQAQLHVPVRHAWATQGRRLDVLRLPWGKLALVVGDDMIFPEVAKLAALAGAHVLACPYDAQEAWEVPLGLRSRAAENRVCIVAASRPKAVGESALLDLEREFTIMTPFRTRAFDGRINDPILMRASPEQEVLRGTLHPEAANNKVMSQDTHLLDQRPYWLVQDLLRKVAEVTASESLPPAAEPRDTEFLLPAPRISMAADLFDGDDEPSAVVSPPLPEALPSEDTAGSADSSLTHSDRDGDAAEHPSRPHGEDDASDDETSM